MATAVEQRSLPHLGAMPYDNMRYTTTPQFTNPWAATNGAGAQHPLYSQQMHQPNAPADQQQVPRPLYPQNTQAGPAPLGPESMHQPRSYATDYVSGPPSNQPAYTSSAAAGIRYSPEQHYSTVGSYGHYETAPRRQSYQTPTMSGRDSFNEALDASRGMVAMSQDYTPRNIYNPRNGAQDSYGFPTTNSPHSSISSASSYPYYGSYNGSVDGSVAGSSITDYSSASEEAMQRTLPTPGQMIGGFPPEPSTMMTQFNSKLAASAQKKHKCKICDKRFTRPSSLQTHMYSHTGEKPFACDFEGCGRHFSVVSNLRRHKKCHRGGSGHASPEEEE